MKKQLIVVLMSTLGLLSRQLMALESIAFQSKEPLAIDPERSLIVAENIEWGLLNPLRGDASPRAFNLWGDRTKNVATGMLVKFKKGFSSPPHIHNVGYRGVVIKGLVHNDDPEAEKMWLPSGSFWTQPAGESHITAAEGEENLIYLEIDRGPYLVLPSAKAFDNGERPINVDQRNLFWLDSSDTRWLKDDVAQIAHLWGEPRSANGSFLKLAPGSKTELKHDNSIKGVVISGSVGYLTKAQKTTTLLSAGSFFSSDTKATHYLDAKTEVVLYLNSVGRYKLK